MNSSATIIGRRRVSDRWIPFKLPERTRAVRFGAGSPTAIRSAEAAREISLGRKKRSPDMRSCHRDISHREIGVLKVVRTGTLKVSKSRHNRDRPFGRTRGSDRRHWEKLDRRLHRSIGDRDFEMSNSLDNKNPEIAICDFAI
jgi:hypothetical protein